MARNKNALRKHYIQAYVAGTEVPGGEWLELAKYISNIGDDTSEEVDTEAYYDGDGTPEQSVTSVAGAYTPEGYYDPKDPAQALIAGLKYKTGDDRKIWHKVISADGLVEHIGKATVTSIVAGAGEANAFEAFSCNIKFDQIPEETKLLPAPTGLEASEIAAISLDLEWDAVSTADSYNVYQNGYLVKMANTNETSITGLTAETYYTFYVTAVKDGKESARSNAITVTTTAA